MTTRTISRRALLAKLGLAAGAAYVAPTMLNLTQARASSYSGRGSGGRRSYSGGGRWFSGRGGGRRRRSFS